MDRLDDEALVTLTLQGKREAFEELVNRYQRQIFNLAYRLTNNYEDAADLSQEVFIHLLKVLKQFDGTRKFFPWMYRTATNVCYNVLKKKPRESVPLEQVVDYSPAVPSRDTQPEDYLDRNETQNAVQQALAELPEQFRLPMVLRYMEEMSYQEIADTMEVPVSTIETRLYRGRLLLQKRLDQVRERRAGQG